MADRGRNEALRGEATRIWARARRAERRARARAWDLLGWAEVGPGATIGRHCRRLVEPGGHLILGAGASVDDGVTLAVATGGRLEIRDHAFVGHHTTLAARSSVVVGRGTFIAELVSIRDHDHDPDQVPSSGAMAVEPVHIDEDVWIASKATVIRGAHIGARSVLAANSVVRGSVGPGEVVGGVPARHLRWVAGFEPPSAVAEASDG